MLTIPVLLVVFYFEPALEEIDMADLCFRSSNPSSPAEDFPYPLKQRSVHLMGDILDLALAAS